MGFSWRELLLTGAKFAGPSLVGRFVPHGEKFAPMIGPLVDAAEIQFGPGQGAEKKAQVKAWAKVGAAGVEGFTGLNTDNPELEQLLDAVIEAEVAVRNAVARGVAAKAALSAYLDQVTVKGAA